MQIYSTLRFRLLKRYKHNSQKMQECPYKAGFIIYLNVSQSVPHDEYFAILLLDNFRFL